MSERKVSQCIPAVPTPQETRKQTAEVESSNEGTDSQQENGGIGVDKYTVGRDFDIYEALVAGLKPPQGP